MIRPLASKLGLVAGLAALVPGAAAPPAVAQNPLFTNVFTADPAARVFSDGRLYLYVDVDPAPAHSTMLNMNAYHAYSTADLRTWTHHGVMLDAHDISWNDGPAWDGDCVEARGRYWYYFPMVDKIGVAVADRPSGPFRDALGRPLITRETPGVARKAAGWLVSPTVLQLEGTSYLYFGQNDELYVVKLKDSMVELDGPVVSVPRPLHFHEGAWFFPRGGRIHAVYGGTDGPGGDKLAYAVGRSPYGPFEFQRFIQEDRAFTVQAAVATFEGRNLLFYHQDAFDREHRRICAEEFAFTPDGLVPVVPRTKAGLGPIELRIDPLGRHEAEDFQASSPSYGVDTHFEPRGEGNRVVSKLGGTAWLLFRNVDFGAGVAAFEADVSLAESLPGGEIELRLGAPEGQTIATCTLPPPKGWYEWQRITCPVRAEAKGVNDLYLLMKGESRTGFYYEVAFMLDRFRFVSP